MIDIKTSTTYTATTGPYREPLVIKMTPEDYKNRWFPSYCDRCQNNPANGGSGVCFCTLGITPVTC